MLPGDKLSDMVLTNKISDMVLDYWEENGKPPKAVVLGKQEVKQLDSEYNKFFKPAFLDFPAGGSTRTFMGIPIIIEGESKIEFR